MIGDLNAGRRAGDRVRLVRTEFPAEEKFAALNAAPRQPITRAPTAFVTVQEGCDKFCTFCVVPYTRGAEVSRATADIVAEARALATQGVCEVTLLGQNVNAWQDRNPVCGSTGCWRNSHRLKALNACDHHQPSARYGRGADCRTWAQCQINALSPPARAIWFGPHIEGNEPPSHARAIS